MKQILEDYSQIIDVTPDPKKIEGNKKINSIVVFDIFPLSSSTSNHLAFLERP